MVAMPSTDPPLPGDAGIVQEAVERWHACKEWQGVEDERAREDIKFANGDERNTWQWPSKVYQQRTGAGGEDGVCLTINNTRVHNDLIINQLSKSNFGVKVRPTGGGASYESAKVMQGIINRIKQISHFTTHRRKVAEQQVDGGIGYILIETKHVSAKSFDQEIFLRSSRDPTAVYLDPWITEPDGSDARFGFVFERVSRKEFERKYPEWKNKVGAAPLDSAFADWMSDKEIVLVKYFRKKDTPDTLVAWKNEDGGWTEKLASEIKDESGEEIYKALREDIDQGKIEGKTRAVRNEEVAWFLIAGDKIIERGDWAGKYIPICRCVGRELVIDNTLDRKGMTRSLIGAQRMLNYSASMSIEQVSLQPRASYIASARAIEGQEQFKTMNINNFPVILYNDVDDEAPEGLQKIDPPIRQEPPQPAQGHMVNMQSAERWSMMISGQFQAQMGEADTQSADSGIAISRRQQQGDTATYHFPEHQTDMLRYIGVQLLDLIPKIYDNERTMHIIDDKNEKQWIRINPSLDKVIQQLEHDKDDEEAIKIAFNPKLGEYECISEPGPDYATQREEAWSAMALIMQSNKEIAASCADLLFKYGDFPGADELMARLQKEIKANKPYLFDDNMEPQLLALQEQNKNLVELNKELMDKLAEMQIRRRGYEEKRDTEVYKAETDRVHKVADATVKLAGLPGTQEELMSLIHQAVADAMQVNLTQIHKANAETIGDPGSATQ